MKELAEWLTRLKAAPPEDLGELVYRVVLPGHFPVGFSDTLVKLEPVGLVVPRPGATDPGTISLLRFFDTTAQSYASVLIAAEIGSLLALASDRRIEVALELQAKVEGRPDTERHFLPYGSVLDRHARGPLPVDLREKFIDLASRVPSLGESDLDAIGAATKLHYGALLLCEHDFRSAYLLLVAALEVLSRSYGNPPTSWSDWEGSNRWDQILVNLALTPDHREAIRAELMKDRHLRLKATFKNYIVSALPDSFWSLPWIEWHTPLHIRQGISAWGEPKAMERSMESVIPDRETLRSSLGHTYDLRSGVVHRGEDVNVMRVGIKAGEPVLPDEPVPYSLLRHILRILIHGELLQRSSAVELPNIRFI